MNSRPSSSESKPFTTIRRPSHVAVIMDGNGRWAERRLLNRIKGHEKGVEAVRTIIRTSHETGISVLTLYAFSTENWQRPEKEISALMVLLKKFLKKERRELVEKNIRLNAIGQIYRMPQDVQTVLEETIELTKHNDGMLLNLALSYGGRSEIVDMVRELAAKSRNGILDPKEITAEIVSDHLYTRGIPDPDLLIRTSGEMRISNFLLWQIAYTEIFVTETLWPDFSKEEFLDILNSFEHRKRRFGGIESSTVA